MSRRKLKSIDIDFFKKNKQLTFYLMMIIFLIALLISKLNFSYGSSTKAYISDNVLIHGKRIGTAEVISDTLLDTGSCISGQIINPTDVVIHQTGCIDVDAERMHESLKNANNDPYAGTSYCP